MIQEAFSPIAARTLGGCRCSPADQASHVAHSACAFCTRSLYLDRRCSASSHCSDSSQTPCGAQKRDSRQD